MDYRPRVADSMVADALRRSGAVLIEGAKVCGKTSTAEQTATSVVRVDVDPTVEIYLQTEPSRVLAGPTPRLIDEWQRQPVLWDLTRRAVADRRRFARKPRTTRRGTTNAGPPLRISGCPRSARVHRTPSWSRLPRPRLRWTTSRCHHRVPRWLGRVRNQTRHGTGRPSSGQPDSLHQRRRHANSRTMQSPHRHRRDGAKPSPPRRSPGRPTSKPTAIDRLMLSRD